MRERVGDSGEERAGMGVITRLSKQKLEGERDDEPIIVAYHIKKFAL